MSQRIVTPWLNTNVPGAYTNTQVISNASGLATSGVVLIMGEASAGPDYTVTTLANNFFGPSALNTVRSIYGSGPIVDGFAALCASSNDPDITGAPSSIYICKTNRGREASAFMLTHSASTYGTLVASNYGSGGNQYSYTTTALQAEVAPTITGNTITSYSGLSGATFTVRVNGGPSIVITPTGTITNVATLVTSLNATFTAMATTLVAAPGTAPNTVSISLPADAAAYSEGFGKSFELIDSTPGDLAALGFSSGLYTSSDEPAVEVQIVNSSTGLNETLNISPVIALSMGYEGTTATGGIGANLSIELNQFTTIGQLAAYINSQPGYSASYNSSVNSNPTSALDQVTALGIASTADVQPGRIKNSVAAFEAALSTSTAVNFTSTAVAGLPDPAALAYLSGGLLGPTLAADIVNAIAQFAGIQVNIIVPLFSQDATADIAAGNTSPSSTYTINAINELLKSHCIQYSTPTLKRNRTAILSINDTYANCKVQAQELASYRCDLTCQQVTQINSLGNSTLFLPWYAACLAAGMQTAGFYKSICNHLTNAISFQDPAGYNSGDPDDVSDALTAGLLVLAQNTSGILWVSDQTTYGLDQNFVYNSIQSVYLSDILSLDLAQSFQTAIVGKSVADVSAASALSFLQQRFDYYKKLKMTTTSSDAPLGYKNASIQITAPSMYVNVEAKLTTSIYFVAINLALSAVTQSAS